MLSGRALHALRACWRAVLRQTQKAKGSDNRLILGNFAFALNRLIFAPLVMAGVP